MISMMTSTSPSPTVTGAGHSMTLMLLAILGGSIGALVVVAIIIAIIAVFVSKSVISRKQVVTEGSEQRSLEDNPRTPFYPGHAAGQSQPTRTDGGGIVIDYSGYGNEYYGINTGLEIPMDPIAELPPANDRTSRIDFNMELPDSHINSKGVPC